MEFKIRRGEHMTNQTKCPGDWPDDWVDKKLEIKIDEDGNVSIDWN